MKKKLLGLCALTIAALPLVAAARTQPGILGNPFFNTDASCFTNSGGLVANTCSSTKTWSIPVAWDTSTAQSGSKIVSVSGNIASGGSLSCSYVGTSPTGTITFNVSFPSFTSGFSTKQVTVTSVPAGTFGQIFCNLSANSTSSIVGANYVQP
jgi:hypothetical protein